MAQAEQTSAPVYDSADLAFFDNVLDDLLGELVAKSYGPAINGNRDALRRQLGAKIFECARAGDRDYIALKQRVLASMVSGKSDVLV